MTQKPCTVCQHREVEAINAQMRLRTSLRKIEGLFSHVTRPSLARHSKHLPPAGIQPLQVEAPQPESPELAALSFELAVLSQSNAPDVLPRAIRGANGCERIALKAERANNSGAASQAWGRNHSFVELLGRITGEIQPNTQNVNIGINAPGFFDLLQRKVAEADLVIDVVAEAMENSNVT